jgi:hypothetical protein
MKKILMVLGCYVFVAGPAQAGERWSAESCKHLQEMKADTYAEATGSEFLVWKLIPILFFQTKRCGVDTQAELAAAGEASKQARLARSGGRAASPRQPMNCYTVPMAGGESTTNCN